MQMHGSVVRNLFVGHVTLFTSNFRGGNSLAGSDHKRFRQVTFTVLPFHIAVSGNPFLLCVLNYFLNMFCFF